MRILDLGCGKNKTLGSVGADISIDSKADIVCNLNYHTLPFKSDTFERVISKQVFEHLNDAKRLKKLIQPPGAEEDLKTFKQTASAFSTACNIFRRTRFCSDKEIKVL